MRTIFGACALALSLVACGQPAGFVHPECERGVCRSPGPELPQECFGDQSVELFDQRIRPLLAGNPDGSCAQCHLRGTGFSAYVREDACTTMACLVENDLVDLQNPEGSHILELIDRAEPDTMMGGILTQEMIDAEHDGFLEWISASAACQESACGEIVDPCAGGPMIGADAGAPPPGQDAGPAVDAGEAPPACLNQAPRYCCGPSLEQSFQQNVWANRGSCNSCHDEQIDLQDMEQNSQSYFFTSSMQQSLDNILSWRTLDETNPGQSLINCANPSQSLLILYPLLEAEGGVFHGGGAKIPRVGAPGYNALLQFVQDYCACRGF